MAPLAPTVGHFPGFCLRKKFPNKCSTFFFGGYPWRGGGGTKKNFCEFFSTAPLVRLRYQQMLKISQTRWSPPKPDGTAPAYAQAHPIQPKATPWLPKARAGPTSELCWVPWLCPGGRSQ